MLQCLARSRQLTIELYSMKQLCCAITAGKTKMEAPTAMLLRSGDVVVLAGESRQYFHGVPRICSPSSTLPELPDGVLDQKSTVAFREFMQGRRINISVRATL